MIMITLQAESSNARNGKQFFSLHGVFSTVSSPRSVFPHSKGKIHSTKSLPGLRQGVFSDKCYRPGVIFHRVVLKEKSLDFFYLFFFLVSSHNEFLIFF